MDHLRRKCRNTTQGMTIVEGRWMTFALLRLWLLRSALGLEGDSVTVLSGLEGECIEKSLCVYSALCFGRFVPMGRTLGCYRFSAIRYHFFTMDVRSPFS